MMLKILSQSIEILINNKKNVNLVCIISVRKFLEILFDAFILFVLYLFLYCLFNCLVNVFEASIIQLQKLAESQSKVFHIFIRKVEYYHVSYHV